jgi:hypothetical protein
MNRELKLLLYLILGMLSEEDLEILLLAIKALSESEGVSTKGKDELRCARDVFAGTWSTKKNPTPTPLRVSGEVRSRIRACVRGIRQDRKTDPDVTTRFTRILQGLV